jgi:hypothetical protein
MNSRYWFARYREASTDLYYQLFTWKWSRGGLPRPVTAAGWVLFWGAITAMTGGGVVAIASSSDGTSRGWWGLAYGAWVLLCIVAVGLAMNTKTDPDRSAEDYQLETLRRKIGDRN